MRKEILVVDDDKNVGDLISEYLREDCDSYNILVTDSGEKAIELLNNKFFDLLITDIIMPGINGLQLTEFVFDKFPKTKILACSGGGTSGKLVAGMALDQALQEGAANAIMKPFTQEELCTKVKGLLKI